MDGTQWLNTWSNTMKTKGKEGNKLNVQTENYPDLNPMQSLFNPKLPVIPTVPLISQSALSQLQQLYGKQPDSTPNLTATGSSDGTLPAEKMEAHIELVKMLKNVKNFKKDKITADLSDVSLD